MIQDPGELIRDPNRMGIQREIRLEGSLDVRC